MNWKWILKMLPYFGIVLWTVFITIFVVRNTDVVNHNVSDRYTAICIESNKNKALIENVIAKHTEIGTDAEKLLWVKLYVQLTPQLIQSNCDNSKVSSLPASVTTTTKSGVNQ